MGGPRILLVEDHPEQRELVRLWMVGAQIVEVGTMREAQEWLGVQTFDAIVSDLGLPNGRGVDVVLAIRRLSDAPLIVFTGDDSENMQRECYRAGADEVFVKGQQDQNMAAMVQRACWRRAAQGGLMVGKETKRDLDAVREGEMSPEALAEKLTKKRRRAAVWWTVAALGTAFALYVLSGALDAAKAGREFSATFTLIGVGFPGIVALFAAHMASGEATKAALSGVVSAIRRGRKATKGEAE